METKSNNLLVGSFTLLVLGALFVFALWVGRVQLDRTYAYYELVFEGSVSGLRQASTVQYNGIPVGRVIDLHLAEDDPQSPHPRAAYRRGFDTAVTAARQQQQQLQNQHQQKHQCQLQRQQQQGHHQQRRRR